jgi:phospholipase A1
MRVLLIFLAIFLYANEFKKSFADLIKDYKDSQTKENVKQIFSRNFSLYPYKENYILPVTINLDQKDEKEAIETKFQISIMKPFYKGIFDDEIYFFAYTQVSWWQIMKDSAPFRENNYEPELFVMFPTEKYHKNWDAVIFGLNHQSNGRDREYSRSWNRAYVRFLFHFEKLIFNMRIWYRFSEPKKRYPSDPDGDDNPDILDYLGYGDMKIMFPYKDNLFTSLIRYNTSTQKGAIELSYSKPIKNDMFLYAQYFFGYAESLIDYNKKISRFGIGFSYSR